MRMGKLMRRSKDITSGGPTVVGSAKVVPGVGELTESQSESLNACNSWERTNTGIIIYSQQTLTHSLACRCSFACVFPWGEQLGKKSGKWQLDKLNLRV